MRLALIAMVAAGCESGGGPSGPATCAALSGLYEYHFTNEWTNDAVRCPVPADFEIVLPQTGSNPGCVIAESNGSSCSVSVQITCPDTIDGFAGQSVRISSGDSDPAGDKLTGSVQAKVVWDNGQGECDASWDYAATRIHQ